MTDQLRGQDTRRARSLWPMVFAPIVWALHFCTSYAIAAIWCNKIAGDADVLRLTLTVVSLVALVMIVFIGWRSWRQWDYTDDYDYQHDDCTDEDRREFLGHAGFLLAIISAVGVIYATLPTYLTDICQ